MLDHLTRITPYTIVQPGVLRRQLGRVLREDYATTVEEMSLGACSVAVPVRASGEVVARVGIVVPSLRRDRDKLVTAMQVTARGIGRALERSGRGRCAQGMPDLQRTQRETTRTQSASSAAARPG